MRVAQQFLTGVANMIMVQDFDGMTAAGDEAAPSFQALTYNW
jgi:hypothetical protein